MSSDKKKWNKTEKDRKNMETENTIPYLNSLKPFKFEPKTNIGDITSRSSDDEEEGAEYKVKWINNNEWCQCSAKALVNLLQNRYQICNFIKKGLQHRCFPMRFTKSLITLFYRTPLLWLLLLTVNCVNQWKHTLKVYADEKEMIYLKGTSKFSASRKRVLIWGFPNTVGSAPF